MYCSSVLFFLINLAECLEEIILLFPLLLWTKVIITPVFPETVKLEELLQQNNHSCLSNPVGMFTVALGPLDTSIIEVELVKVNMLELLDTSPNCK